VGVDGRKRFAVFCAAVLVVSAAGQGAPAVLIRHGLIYGGVLAGRPSNGDILIENGKIKAVGPALPAPAGARIVDVGGKPVTSAPMAVSHTLLMTSNIADADDQASALVPAARKVAVSRLMSMPAACKDVFCGPARIVHMGLDFDTAVTDNAGVWVRLEEGGKPTHPDLWTKIRTTIDDARNYAAGRGAFFRPGEQRSSKADVMALGAVLDGEIPLLVAAEHADVITRIARLAEAEKMKLVVFDGGEAWKIAGLLKALRVPVAFPAGERPPFELSATQLKNAVELDRAGVAVIFVASVGTGTGAAPMHLAAQAVQAGMKPDRALAAVTSTPAEAFGLAGYGSLTPGRDADLAIWNADPFAPAATPVGLFVKGEEIPLGIDRKSHEGMRR
jgi:imidazolonepropionase-like amidohydrolase